MVTVKIMRNGQVIDVDVAELNIPAPPASAALVVDALAFRDLFTDDEQLAVAAAGQTDPLIRRFEMNAAAAQRVPLDSPRVLQGIHYLQSLGLLTQNRANQILSGQAP